MKLPHLERDSQGLKMKKTDSSEKNISLQIPSSRGKQWPVASAVFPRLHTCIPISLRILLGSVYPERKAQS